jgi:hypothetical protein
MRTEVGPKWHLSNRKGQNVWSANFLLPFYMDTISRKAKNRFLSLLTPPQRVFKTVKTSP